MSRRFSQVVSAHSFPTTCWPLVARVGHVDPEVKRAALAEVLRAYVPALRSYLAIRRRIRADQADDLLQGFLSDRVLEDDLIPRALKERGRFRTFLLTALEWYVVNRAEYDRARKRAPARVAPLEEALDHAGNEPGPADAFELAWARQVLDQAVGRMRRECEASGRPDVWGVFQGRILLPAMEGAEPVAYDELVRQFSLRDTAAANNLLTTGKRMFARQLKAVIGEYEADESVEQEIADLKQILARGRR